MDLLSCDLVVLVALVVGKPLQASPFLSLAAVTLLMASLLFFEIVAPSHFKAVCLQVTIELYCFLY